MTSDQDLIKQIQQADEAAYERLLQRYEDALRRHLLRLVHEPAAADDLLQETSLRVWTRAEQWQGRGTVKGWLFRIAKNLALNYLEAVRRRRQQSLAVPVEEEDEEEFETPAWMIDEAALGADVLLEQAERRALLQGVVEGLPEEKRQVLHMVYDDEMELHEVAEELDIPLGTIKSRLYYARQHVARQWREIAREWEE